MSGTFGKQHIQRGDIFLWSGTSWIARAIQKITGSKWSHCGIFLGDGKMIDADWDGIKVRSLDPYLAHPDRIKAIRPPLNADQKERSVDFALSLDGKAAYDYALIYALAKAWWFGANCTGEDRDWDDAYVCSELVAVSVYYAAKVKFIPQCCPIETTVPEDIDKLWGKYSYEIKLD